MATLTVHRNRVKRLVTCACAFLAFALVAHADPPDPKRKEVADIIEKITPPTGVYWRESALAGREGSPPEEIAKAREKLEQDKELIPKLRQLLKVDTNVFDYPGLISRGVLFFHGDGPVGGGYYTLWISARFVGREARILPWEFQLEFNDRGIITKIYDVQWK